LWYLCKLKGGKNPDDPEITNMNPVQKLWMYEHWLEDHREQIELAKNHAYLLASFWNPEAVKSIVDDSGKHYTTDEEFEESSNLVKKMNEPITQIKRKRRILR